MKLSGKTASCLQAAATALVIPVLLTACSDSDGLKLGNADSSNQQIGSHSRHTGPAEGVWPPVPSNMTNAVPYPASAREGALAGVLSAARHAIMNNPQVRASLGNDYREMEGALSDSKSSTVANVLFYNYATDETVEAILNRDGSIATQIYSATEYQPGEHPEETALAIDLARAALTNVGYDTTGLTGTAMLAFPEISAIASVEQQFYPSRVLYVTFGAGSGELPVYTALVDLSTAAVIEHGPVK